MSYWSVYKFNSGTLNYDFDGYCPRSNEDIDLSLTSNQQKFILADGSQAFVTPETKALKQPIAMVWYLQDETFLEIIQAYMTNNDYLKIVTHLAGIIFIGRFIACNGKWLTAQDGDVFELVVSFERME